MNDQISEVPDGREHVVTRVNDHRYVCEVCGQAGSERWAILHQFGAGSGGISPDVDQVVRWPGDEVIAEFPPGGDAMQYGSSMSRPQPLTNVVWEYRSPYTPGGAVYVKYGGAVWLAAPTIAGRWERDDRIPEWPGTFTPITTAGAYAHGGIWAAQREYDEFVRRTREDEPSDLYCTAVDAITEIARRRRHAEFADEEARIRDELRVHVRSAIERHLEGHRGIVQGPSALRDHAFDVAAVAAVDALAEYYRERQEGRR